MSLSSREIAEASGQPYELINEKIKRIYDWKVVRPTVAERKYYRDEEGKRRATYLIKDISRTGFSGTGLSPKQQKAVINKWEQKKHFLATNKGRMLLDQLSVEFDQLKSENIKLKAKPVESIRSHVKATNKLKSIARKYAEIQNALSDVKLKKAYLLNSEDGFLDLRKYRTTWTKSHGSCKSWLTVVSTYCAENSKEYQLAVLLDEIARLKAKANRLNNQLRDAGNKLLLETD